MGFSPDPPQEGFDHEREPALRAWGRLLIQINMGKWINEIRAAIGALQQIVIDVRAAIAAFDFIVFGRGRDTGGHSQIVSNVRTKPLKRHRCTEYNILTIPIAAHAAVSKIPRSGTGGAYRVTAAPRTALRALFRSSFLSGYIPRQIPRLDTHPAFSHRGILPPIPLIPDT